MIRLIVEDGAGVDNYLFRFALAEIGKTALPVSRSEFRAYPQSSRAILDALIDMALLEMNGAQTQKRMRAAILELEHANEVLACRIELALGKKDAPADL